MKLYDESVMVPQRPVLPESVAAQYTSYAVLDGWRSTPPDITATANYIVDANGVDEPPKQFRKLQHAINQIIIDGVSRPVVIALASGTHEGPIFVPEMAPPITLIGLGPLGSVIIRAAIDAEMPGSEYLDNFGSMFLEAPASIKEKFDQITRRKTIGTGNSSVLKIEANEFQLKSISVTNAYDCDRDSGTPDNILKDEHGRFSCGQHQAVAIMVAGANRVRFDQVHMSSFQDTLYLQATNPTHPNRVHMVHCEIEGDIDFIFGQSIGLFEHCVIRSRGIRSDQSWATAPSTNIRSPYGFVFRDCRFIHDYAPITTKAEMQLGRQWFENVRATPYGHASIDDYNVLLGNASAYDAPCGVISRKTLEAVGKCVLIDCDVASHINPHAPWGSWNGGNFGGDGVWRPTQWNLRYRPVQFCAADFQRELSDWLLINDINYLDLDTDEIWLGEYRTRSTFRH